MSLPTESIQELCDRAKTVCEETREQLLAFQSVLTKARARVDDTRRVLRDWPLPYTAFAARRGRLEPVKRRAG
jgi:hypothetical protein